MPTIEDLREAFATLDAAAPTELTDVLGAPTSTHRARRTGALVPATAAAAAVIVTVGVAAFVHGVGRTPSAAPATGPYASSLPLTDFVFAVQGLPDGLTAENLSTAPLLQQAAILNSDHVQIASVSLTPGNAARDPLPIGGSTVDVNGHSADEIVVPADQTTPNPPGGSPVPVPTTASPTIAWADTEGSWISVDPVITADETGKLDAPAPAAETMLAIARAVRVEQLVPVRSPAKFSFIPSGLRLQSTTFDDQHSHPATESIELGGAAGGSTGLTLVATAGSIDISNPANGGRLSVTSSTRPASGWGVGGADVVGQTHTTIGAYTCTSDRSGNWMVCDNGSVAVAIVDRTAADRLPGEITKIIEGLTVAPKPGDPSTWFPLADALP